MKEVCTLMGPPPSMVDKQSITAVFCNFFWVDFSSLPWIFPLCLPPQIFIQNLPKDLIYSGQTSFEQNMRTLQTDKGALTVDTVFMCAGYKPIPPPLRGDDVLRAADVRIHGVFLALAK